MMLRDDLWTGQDQWRLGIEERYKRYDGDGYKRYDFLLYSLHNLSRAYTVSFLTTHAYSTVCHNF